MVGSFFSKTDEKEIVEAIRAAERLTTGQIHVHVRNKCEQDALAESHRLFKKLGLHKTNHRNAVLIFLAPESRKLAILGDAGIHEKVRGYFWDRTRDAILDCFKRNEIKKGLLEGIQGVGEKLRRHFPSGAGGTNPLLDAVTED